MNTIRFLRFLAPVPLLACALLSGCAEEQTRQKQEEQQSRLRPARQSGQQEQGGKTPGAPAEPSPPQSGGQPPPTGRPGKPSYLPPSEQGATVEMSETPAGSPPPPPAAREGAAAPAGEAGNPDGGAGGNVPHGIAPLAAPTSSPSAPPPGGSVGHVRQTGPQPGAPQTIGAPLTTQAIAPGDSAEQLSRNREEFDRLMQHAQDAAAAERAGSTAGEAGRQGGRLAPGEHGSSGAAKGATGLGASPDLSGETGGAPRTGGVSAVRGREHGDENVVARQLREAAEREQDPVLKAKLMLEYQRYIQP